MVLQDLQDIVVKMGLRELRELRALRGQMEQRELAVLMV
jgi:hypothetical protein